MQVDEMSVGGDGARRLLAELDEAIEQARSWDYDLPSEAALARARGLIAVLGPRCATAGDVDVGIGIDGSIEFTVGTGDGYAVIEVAPSSRVEMLVRSLSRGEIVSHLRDATVSEVVRELERAA